MTGRALGIPGFFAELETRMDETRRSERRRHQRFFVELNPILDAARKLERELDRHLAHRFNVFHYMGEDHPSELLLSRIIADLLNPAERHGQGTSLLEILVDALPAESGTPKPRPDLSNPVRVQLERVIPKKRRIDITVDITTGAGPWCLAIENKPFAGDQRHQVLDYLEYLKGAYQERFLLIYLSPRGEGPTGYALPTEELPRWRGRFVVMPYWGDPGSAAREGEYAQEDDSGLEDEGGTGANEIAGDAVDDAPEDEQAIPDDVFADFRTSFSLAEWLATCRTQCHADRLRWFLRDAEAFCRQQFGGRSMATDSDSQAIRDYLFSNPSQLETAQTVWDVWPKLKVELCEGFLEHLRAEVHRRVQEELPDMAPGLRVECRYRGEKTWSNFLWLYRAGWPPWEKAVKGHPPLDGCTGVVLQSRGPGPNR